MRARDKHLIWMEFFICGVYSTIIFDIRIVNSRRMRSLFHLLSLICHWLWLLLLLLLCLYHSDNQPFAIIFFCVGAPVLIVWFYVFDNADSPVCCCYCRWMCYVAFCFLYYWCWFDCVRLIFFHIFLSDRTAIFFLYINFILFSYFLLTKYDFGAMQKNNEETHFSSWLDIRQMEFPFVLTFLHLSYSLSLPLRNRHRHSHM